MQKQLIMAFAFITALLLAASFLAAIDVFVPTIYSAKISGESCEIILSSKVCQGNYPTFGDCDSNWLPYRAYARVIRSKYEADRDIYFWRVFLKRPECLLIEKKANLSFPYRQCTTIQSIQSSNCSTLGSYCSRVAAEVESTDKVLDENPWLE